MLGASGAAIQALFANPLASPDLTGTTSGAALGAVVTAYLFGFASPIALSVGAVGGALGTLGLLLLLAGPRAETATLLLAGLAISALAGALTTLALALAPSQHLVEVGVIGLGGGLLGIALAALGLFGVRHLYENYEELTRLDFTMVLAAIGIAVLSGLVAGFYPTWRVCRVQPAAYLKTQ
jgi:iron complex transport system permease protein